MVQSWINMLLSTVHFLWRRPECSSAGMRWCIEGVVCQFSVNERQLVTDAVHSRTSQRVGHLIVRLGSMDGLISHAASKDGIILTASPIIKEARVITCIIAAC